MRRFIMTATFEVDAENPKAAWNKAWDLLEVARFQDPDVNNRFIERVNTPDDELEIDVSVDSR